MRIAERLSTDDAGEPPSLESDEKYYSSLFLAHGHGNVFPAYTNFTNASKEFDVRSFNDMESIEIEASIYGSLTEKYLALDSEEQFELADHIERAIGRTAGRLLMLKSVSEYTKDTTVLINNLPVIFEPINNAMLVGQWEDWEKKKMNIRSQFIASKDQQRLLLGGLASFVTYLEQR